MSLNRADLPTPLYTAEQTRELDRVAIQQFSIPGIRLMQRAGHACFAVMLERYQHLSSITVMCGAGNNGGDGFIIAQLAREHGVNVQLVCIGESDFPASLRGEALQAWRLLQTEVNDYQRFVSGMELTGDVIVDAMLGTGLQGNVRGLFAEAIMQINQVGRPIVAVDAPSGLCADSGQVLGCAVEADCTISFIGLKRGLFTSEAVNYVGAMYFDDLLVPDSVYDSVAVNVFRTTQADVRRLFPPRARSSHKGINGHVLVVGGEQGMGGAALLASQAALRSGAGLVTLATREEHVSASLMRCPEVMVRKVHSGQDLLPLIAQADVIVIGPGLGQNAWGEQMLAAVLASKKPHVLDADALNLMVKKGLFVTLDSVARVCTPHPGEAARMLHCSVDEVELDRFATVEQLQKTCGGAVLLKGAGSVSTAGDAIHLCSAGNPGMSVAGMGDVLSGVCGAFLAQGLSAEDALRLAVYVHASAADAVVASQGERGLLASDLMPMLMKIIN